MFSQQLSSRASSTLWAEGHEFELILDFFLDSYNVNNCS